MKHNIICIGELLWDMLPDNFVLGGAPANLAFRLKESGCKVNLVSRIGKDSLGDLALKELLTLGLSPNWIQKDELLPTGTVEVVFDKDKNPDYNIIKDVAYDKMELTSELIQLANDSNCIAFGTLAQRSKYSENTIEGIITAAPNAVKFLDVNFRKDCFTKESVKKSLFSADILKANHHEAYMINKIFKLNRKDLPSICTKISEVFNIKTIVVTMEEYGVFLHDSNDGEYYSPGYKISLEDPLGAGDAFSAGFIKAIFGGRSLMEATEEGNCYGAVVATKKGATQAVHKNELMQISQIKNRIIKPELAKFCNIAIN